METVQYIYGMGQFRSCQFLLFLERTERQQKAMIPEKCSAWAEINDASFVKLLILFRLLVLCFPEGKTLLLNREESVRITCGM